MYVMECIRPDIVHVVGVISGYILDLGREN